jgi:hypothetical protein
MAIVSGFIVFIFVLMVRYCCGLINCVLAWCGLLAGVKCAA